MRINSERSALRSQNNNTLNSLSDELLAVKVARGESTALEVLYDRHAAIVFGIALKVIGDRHQWQGCAQS